MRFLAITSARFARGITWSPRAASATSSASPRARTGAAPPDAFWTAKSANTGCSAAPAGSLGSNRETRHESATTTASASAAIPPARPTCPLFEELRQEVIDHLLGDLVHGPSAGR